MDKEIQNARNKEESIAGGAFQVYGLRAPIGDKGDLLCKRLLDHEHTTFLTEVSFESVDQSDVAPIHEIERISNQLLLKNKTIDLKGDIQIIGLIFIYFNGHTLKQNNGFVIC